MKITYETAMSTVGNDLEFKISECGYALCDTAWKQDGVHIPYSRLFYIVDGEAEIYTEEKTVVLTPGNAYFLPFDFSMKCDCRHSLEKLYVHFNIPFLGKLDLFEGYSEILSFPCPHIEELVTLFQNPTLLNLTKLKAMFFADAVKVMELTKRFLTPVPVLSDVVKSAVLYIDEHISSNLKITDIASALYVSESRLSKAFSKELGITIGKYITNKLMLEIKFCLISGMTTDDILDKFAFCDKSYYIRFFKQKAGLTPHRYKKAVMQKTHEEA